MFSTQPLNIAIDCRMLDWGGVGRYTEGLIRGLSQISTHHKFILICHSKEEMYLEKLNNFKIIETNLPVFSLRHIKAFSQLVSNLNLDVFHSPHFIYPWFYKGKGVATIHDLIPLKFPKTLFFKERTRFLVANKFTINKVNHIITVSNNTKKDIIDLLKIDESKISTIYEAADNFNNEINNLNIDINDLNLPDEFILYVGAFRLHKNIKGILNAYKFLPEVIKEKYKLVFVGKDDTRYIPFEKLVKNFNLEKYIFRINSVSKEQLVNVFKKAKLLLMPSFYEGFGLPALEAMSLGTPVIASDVSSFPEILGNNAVLVDPFNVKGISEAILLLLDNREKYEYYKSKGIKRATDFSWLKTAEETIKVYEKVGFS